MTAIYPMGRMSLAEDGRPSPGIIEVFPPEPSQGEEVFGVLRAAAELQDPELRQMAADRLKASRQQRATAWSRFGTGSRNDLVQMRKLVAQAATADRLQFELSRVLAEAERQQAPQSFGLVFEDSVEEIDLHGLRPKRGDRVQARVGFDPARFEVVGVDKVRGDVAVRPMVRDKGCRWRFDLSAPVGIRAVGELTVTVDHDAAVRPGLVPTGRVGKEEVGRPVHVAIRGENLHALQALTYTQAGSVDLVYIDPPYNTGNDDWVYNDRWVNADDTFRHSKWLAFMSRRLELLKTLLRPTGIIIVAVGDDEHHQLRMLMDQVFGERNFISNLVWQGGRKNDSRYVSNGADYMLVYARDESALSARGVRWREEKPGIREALGSASRIWEKHRGDHETATKEWRSWLRQFSLRGDITDGVSRYTSLDQRTGEPIYTGRDLSSPTGNGPRYDVLHPVTRKPVKVPSRGWVFASASRMAEEVDAGRVRFGPDENSGAQGISYLSEMCNQVASSVFDVDRRRSSKTVRGIFDDKRFPFPKDHQVLMRWIRMVAPTDAVVLDCFGGSNSTMEAVLRLNEEDGGHRQAITVTNNELGPKLARSLAAAGIGPGDDEWDSKGVFEHVARPRIETIVDGKRPDGSTYDKAVAPGQQVQFFELVWLSEARVRAGYEFERLAPLLWLRAGGLGEMPERGTGPFVLGEKFAVLFEPTAVRKLVEQPDMSSVETVFVVTDSDAALQAAAAALPDGVEVRQLYQDYLTQMRGVASCASR